MINENASIWITLLGHRLHHIKRLSLASRWSISSLPMLFIDHLPSLRHLDINIEGYNDTLSFNKAFTIIVTSFTHLHSLSITASPDPCRWPTPSLTTSSLSSSTMVSTSSTTSSIGWSSSLTSLCLNHQYYPN
jgi:hypothetical protein